MRLNQNIQYGLLFGLYLARAGRAKVSDVAEQLGVSASLLEQVAGKLRKAGVINSIRGPGGGYELHGDPSIKAFFEVLEPVKMLKDKQNYMKTQEHRALARFSDTMALGILGKLDTSIRSIMQNLIKFEVNHFEKLEGKGVITQ